MAKVLIVFNDEKDAALLEWLDSQPNKSASVRALIRQAIQAKKSNGATQDFSTLGQSLEEIKQDFGGALSSLQRQLDELVYRMEQGTVIVPSERIVTETLEQAQILDSLGNL